MEELEYKIGGLEIKTQGEFILRHKFVVEVKNKVCSIYITSKQGHNDIVFSYKLDQSKIVGGGDLYMRKENEEDEEFKIVLGRYSTIFDSIPNSVAEKFSELLSPELKKRGIKFKGFKFDMSKSKLSQYWRRLE